MTVLRGGRALQIDVPVASNQDPFGQRSGRRLPFVICVRPGYVFTRYVGVKRFYEHQRKLSEQ